MANDYKVGPGCPPLETRFKKGQSGNPKGRPKKKKPVLFEDHLEVALTSFTVPVTLPNGRTKRMTARQAMAYHVIVGALKGDKDCRKIVKEHDNAKAAQAQTKVGAVVLYPPCRTTEEFMAKHGGQKLPINPLEGLPGIDPDMYFKRSKRAGLPVDDD